MLEDKGYSTEAIYSSSDQDFDSGDNRTQQGTGEARERV